MPDPTCAPRGRVLSVLTTLAVAVAVTLAGEAKPASIIKDPNPPRYKLEIEPKLNLSYFGLWRDYGGNGWGPGVRFSIPIVSPGFITPINNSVAISFGADLVRYEGYGYYRWCNDRRCREVYAGYDDSFWAVHLPVTMQWNFWLTEKWSVFAEPGLTIRHAFHRDDPYYDTYCDPRVFDCRKRDSTNLYFTFFAGGRFHFSDRMALTMRLGHPIDLSLGLSIFL